jgi:isopentenyl diphosphate isomerase/L-lactate dehydrogenase-like FMN-dependent dehydrogenase
MNPSKSILTSVLTCLALAQSASAQPLTRTEVTEIKPLLLRAIDQGAAHGVLVGESATYLRQKFDARSPIEIDVQALHPLPQPGCSRLEVKTRQKDVLEKTQRSDKELVYQVSYCRDGRFPDKR